MSDPLPCPKCGDVPVPVWNFACVVSCAECADGATDAPQQIVGVSMSREKAVGDWNDQVSDKLADMEFDRGQAVR